MRWFREHKNLVAILGVVLILLTIMILSYTNAGKTSAMGNLAGWLASGVQQPISKLGNNIAEGITSVFSFGKTKQENETLKIKIADLNKKIVSLQLTTAELNQLKELQSALNYKGVKNSYTYVTADVVAIDDSDLYKIFTINVGTEEGVQKDAVVLNGDGLIGRVFSAGKHWAKVIAVIDENNSVSFRVFRDVNLLGVLSGDGKGKLNGYMLDSQSAVIEGDMLITSGLGTYPEGIMIGKVTEAVWQNDQLIKAVSIDPSVDFNSIRKVMVLSAPKAATSGE
jgi:rod shape-determining protein MreC